MRRPFSLTNRQKWLLLPTIVIAHSIIVIPLFQQSRLPVFVTIQLFLLFGIGWILGPHLGTIGGIIISLTVNWSIPNFGPESWQTTWPLVPLLRTLLLTSTAFVGGHLGELRVRLWKKEQDRKKAEQAVRDSEQRYRTLVESAPEAIFVLDVNNHQIIDANKNTFRLLGYDQEQLYSKAMENLSPDVAPDGSPTRQFLKNYFQRVLSGETLLLDWTLYGKEGNEIPCQIYLLRLPSKTGNLIRGSIIDISQNKKKEEEINRFFKISLEMLCIAGTDGYFKRVNPAFEATLGYSEEELLSRPFKDFIHPDDLTATQNEVASLSEGVPTVRFINRYRRIDGSYRWLEWDSMPVVEEGLIYAAARDITAAKEAEIKLQLTRSAVDTAAEAIFTVSPAGRILDANQTACQRLEYTREELLTMSIADIDPFFHQDSWSKHWEEIKEHGHLVIESKHNTKNGRVFPVEVSIGHFQFAGSEYCCSFVRDISERQKAEKALRKSENTLRGVLDNIPDYVLTVDQQGTILFINRASPENKRDAIIGKSVYESLSSEDREIVKNALRIVFQQGKTKEFGISSPQFEGRSHWYVCRVAPIFLEGRVKTAIFVASDVTARKNAEEKLRKHQAELTHVTRLSTMGEMVTGLAHELNQPLTAIANTVHSCDKLISKEETLSRDKLQPLINIISDQSFRASEIIRRLRNLVNKSEPSKTPVDINKLIPHVITLVEGEARLNKIQLSTKLCDSPSWVIADSIQIEQVIINLVKNAFESFSSEDSVRNVSIETKILESNECEILVRDSGKGISEENIKMLFKPFYSTKEQGMGMGLAICRSIAEAHEGRLWANQNELSGACFHFILPVAEKGPVNHDQ